MIKLRDGRVYAGDSDLGAVSDLKYSAGLDYGEGCFIIQQADGSVAFIPEQGATADEAEVFAAWKEAHKDDQPQQPSLNELKAAKLAELDAACTADILSGFYSSAGGAVDPGTLWGMDWTDQANLAQQGADIGMGEAVEPIYWKVKWQSTVVPLTIIQFKALWNDGKATKRDKIGRAWMLKAQVSAATTPEEVLAIVW